jgi:hypothetical protein
MMRFLLGPIARRARAGVSLSSFESLLSSALLADKAVDSGAGGEGFAGGAGVGVDGFLAKKLDMVCCFLFCEELFWEDEFLEEAMAMRLKEA